MTVLPELHIPKDFFREEIRDGFRVDISRKKIWAVELDLYAKLLAVCKKHNLMLYADAGTLLGTVRHEGFIPWDDDMDFVMFREDYDKLCEVGENEFKAPYYFQSDDNCKAYRHGHVQLRNSNTTAILLEDLKGGYRHNQGIFIDVFPIDGLPEASERTEYWRELIELNERAKGFQKQGNIEMSLESFRMFEQCLKHYAPRERKKAALLSYELNGKKGIRYVSDYSKAIQMKFEFTEMNVPVGYKRILRTIYGTWKKPIMCQSDHGDVIFDVSKPYTEYLTKS